MLGKFEEDRGRSWAGIKGANQGRKWGKLRTSGPDYVGICCSWWEFLILYNVCWKPSGEEVWVGVWHELVFVGKGSLWGALGERTVPECSKDPSWNEPESARVKSLSLHRYNWNLSLLSWRGLPAQGTRGFQGHLRHCPLSQHALAAWVSELWARGPSTGVYLVLKLLTCLIVVLADWHATPYNLCLAES